MRGFINFAASGTTPLLQLFRPRNWRNLLHCAKTKSILSLKSATYTPGTPAGRLSR